MGQTMLEHQEDKLFGGGILSRKFPNNDETLSFSFDVFISVQDKYIVEKTNIINSLAIYF